MTSQHASPPGHRSVPLADDRRRVTAHRLRHLRAHLEQWQTSLTSLAGLATQDDEAIERVWLAVFDLDRDVYIRNRFLDWIAWGAGISKAPSQEEYLACWYPPHTEEGRAQAICDSWKERARTVCLRFGLEFPDLAARLDEAKVQQAIDGWLEGTAKQRYHAVLGLLASMGLVVGEDALWRAYREWEKNRPPSRDF